MIPVELIIDCLFIVLTSFFITGRGYMDDFPQSISSPIVWQQMTHDISIRSGVVQNNHIFIQRRVSLRPHATFSACIVPNPVLKSWYSHFVHTCDKKSVSKLSQTRNKVDADIFTRSRNIIAQDCWQLHNVALAGKNRPTCAQLAKTCNRIKCY